MPTRSSGSVKVFSPPHDRDELIARLRERVPALRLALPARRVVLFGSWAVGRATAFSDIDLLVVYAGPRREDAYALVRRTLGLRGLEPHVYSEEEAERLQTMLQRMTRHGIPLSV
ncbi:MAG: nucleotidyltransferase domain-containing protein [Gemmatimonadetes bacterium]|nr:nucleotidyltransferase domain-containing protein [Gemmatimonadota bacterium]MBI2403213.1 nucleotidyltransferase domain-containing protein [Gemmatimonadota bacterium]MBI2536466.1 nucleotidyltransferase domain-containing protein [Gemmatimonadota bacterium]MBI2615945.1 nucleotidyltransferase domain-containing protein [Gemmatimonadota bacterium]